MAHKQSIEDFEADGFTVYSNDERPKKPIKKIEASQNSPTPPSKVIIMDTREVLKAVQASNETLKHGLENLITTMYSMDKKPDNFTLSIERDARGFMTNIKVKVNK